MFAGMEALGQDMLVMQGTDAIGEPARAAIFVRSQASEAVVEAAQAAHAQATEPHVVAVRDTAEPDMSAIVMTRYRNIREVHQGVEELMAVVNEVYARMGKERQDRALGAMRRVQRAVEDMTREFRS